MVAKYEKMEVAFGEGFAVVDCLNSVYLLRPDQGGPGCLFVDKRTGRPTHVALWTPETCRTILSELNVIVQNLPITN